MAIQPNGATRRQLRTLFSLGVIGELTDGQLLERFASRGGEAAELDFSVLVERHGPMVLRVCRNTLRDPNDVQDAFQATFLVLVQKARSLWVRDSLGPWLHRVAYRVATRARSSAARRRVHERQAAATRQTLFSERGDRDDLVPLLHEEIDRLPERYRVPVVLCDLQGLTHEKAARHLGWPVGTVKSRLARARELLRDRLSRRVPGLLAGLLIAEKALGGALRAVEVVVPGTLVESTIRAAAPFAAGKALAAEVVSTRVAILIEEVLKTMFLTKLKLAAGVVLLIGAAGAAGVLAQPGAGSAGRPAANKPHGPAAAESRPAPEVDSAPAPAPAYITQSRAMIITRLAEEVAEARARLDRTFRKVRSPEDPAVVHARKTLDDLQQRLDRIDRVLVDVVETYPTMFDFSGESPIEADLARAKDRAEWAKRMFDKGYVSKWQADAELTKYETLKARSEAGQPQRSRQQGGERSGKPGSQQGRDEQSPDRGEAGPKRQGDQQQGKSPSQGQQSDQQQGKSQGQGQQGNQQQGKSPGRGQKDSPKDDQIPDGGKAGQGRKDNPKDDQSPDEEKGGPKQQADPQLEKSPD